MTASAFTLYTVLETAGAESARKTELDAHPKSGNYNEEHDNVETCPRSHEGRKRTNNRLTTPARLYEGARFY